MLQYNSRIFFVYVPGNGGGGGGGGGWGGSYHVTKTLRIMGIYLSTIGQSLEHNGIKTRELDNSIIGKNWSIMWQGLITCVQSSA